MAVVFLLGPSEWDLDRGPGEPTSPMDYRRAIATVLRGRGHRVTVMEDEPDAPGADIHDKFLRILREKGVTDIALYWPPKAKMQTTFDELIILRTLTGSLPRVWAFYHKDVAVIDKGSFQVLETGHRSRYLTAVAKLGIRPFSWTTTRELSELTDRIAFEL